MADVVNHTQDAMWAWDLLRVLRLLYDAGPGTEGSAQDSAHHTLAALVREDAQPIVRALQASRLTTPFVALADGTPVLDAFPADVRQDLRQACERQRESNAGYLQLLAQYTAALEQAGIDVLLLKGLYIAQRFYGSVDQRFMWDADVLVRPEGYRPAIRVAQELGMPVSGPNAPRWLLRLASLHAIEVRRDTQAIDIHWCLRARPGYRIDYAGLWSRACTMDIGEHAFRVLADEDALLLALLELASDMERGRIKLRSLWDFYLVLTALDAHIDWQVFLDGRRNEGLLPLAVNMLSFGLYCVEGHAAFPAVAGALQEHAALLLVDSAECAREILARPRKHLANRSLYARLQPAPVPAYWLRRALTSPLRKALG